MTFGKSLCSHGIDGLGDVWDEVGVLDCALEGSDACLGFAV